MPAGDVTLDLAGVSVVLMWERSGEGLTKGFCNGAVVGVDVGAECDGLVWCFGGSFIGLELEEGPVLARVLSQGTVLH